MDPPRSTAGAPLDGLLELVQGLKRSLVERREAPRGSWVEEVAEDLRAGRRVGWYYPPSNGGGLTFYAARGADAFGHVHVEPGPDRESQAMALSSALLDALPPTLQTIDVGFTGLDRDTERRLLDRLSSRTGSTIIEREALERPIGPEDGGPAESIPAGLVRVPLTDVTVDALADLDQRAFAGTVDELLVGRGFENHRRVMEALLSGSLGAFLGPASCALVESEVPRLAAVFLAAEESPRRAILLSFMVDPAHRRKGLGRHLMRWGLRALWALGYSSVHLWVTLANAPARALYAAFGFRPFAFATIYRWERAGAAPQPHSDR